MIEERLVTFDQAEKNIGAERLHETLNAAEAGNHSEIVVDGMACGAPFLLVITEELFAFSARKHDVGIEEQRREIVFGEAGTHALEIDQVGLAIADDDVLGLKISVDQDPRSSCEIVGDLLQFRQGSEL